MTLGLGVGVRCAFLAEELLGGEMGASVAHILIENETDFSKGEKEEEEAGLTRPSKGGRTEAQSTPWGLRLQSRYV